MGQKEVAIEREAVYGFLPPLKRERQFGFWDFLAVQVCFGIASWAFLIGSFTGLTVDAYTAVVALLIGNSLPLFTMSYYSVMFARYGSDQFLLPRKTFGYRGSTVFFLVWVAINWGYIMYSAFLFGESMIKIIAAFNPYPETHFVWTFATEVPGATIWAIVASILAWYVTIKGPVAIKWLTRFSAPFLLIVCGMLVYFVFSIYGIQNVLALPPPAPIGDAQMSRASVVEWSLGLGWGGWGYYYGPWSRIALTESAAFQGPFWGWGPLEMVAAIPSAFTAIVTGDVDPTAWMIKIFGLAGGILALVLMAVANITSICCLSYSQAIPIKYYKPQWSWFKAVATNFPAIALFFPLIFYKYASVLAMEGSVAAPYAAILIVDQFIVRKGRFNLKELFYKAPGCMSERGYVKGFFVPAWVVWIVSILFYYTMYNPMTYTTGPLGFIFYWATAQIPEFILAFVLYLAIMKAGKFF